MTTTIKDVAREVGVSPMTVSRALRDSPLVSVETKQKVLQVAEKLGYIPNLLARGLVQNRSALIGLVVTEVANPFFAPVITAIQAIARARNYLVIIGDSERLASSEDACLKQFGQMRVSGLVITPLDADSSALRAWRKSGTPVVVIARRWEYGDCVAVDNVAGGRMVGDHLVRLGHRHIACICLDEPGNTAVGDRVQGFRQVLDEAGIGLAQESLIFTKTVRVEDGIRAADTLLNRSPRPSAVFVTADRLAVGFIHRLLERGVRVPDDVAIVGYDDIRYSAFLQVPLTTVALPKREMGEMAAQLLFERIERPVGPRAKPRQVLLQPELVVRASCGADQARSVVAGERPIVETGVL